MRFAREARWRRACDQPARGRRDPPLARRTRIRNGYDRGIELNPAVIRAIHEVSVNFRNSASLPETCKYCMEAKAPVAQSKTDKSTASRDVT